MKASTTKEYFRFESPRLVQKVARIKATTAKECSFDFKNHEIKNPELANI